MTTDSLNDDIPTTYIIAQFVTESGDNGKERTYIVRHKSDRDAILKILVDNKLCYQVEVK